MSESAKDRVLSHLRFQVEESKGYGSPFMLELCARFADDLEAGGPIEAVVGDWPGQPRADAVAMRLGGALHYAVLSGRDPALAASYPASDPNWRMDKVWPLARAFFAREREWVRGFLQSPPQTNETRRAIALLAGFLAIAQDWRGPIDMLELGASAGLNTNWDRFRYRTESWSWGPAESSVLVETDWRGPAPPLDATPHIRNRAACDRNPLDIRDQAQLLQLKSYIWADQPDRLARFDAAVALAIANDTRVDRADAAEWVAQKLAARAGDAATVVYHSIFLQYPPAEARAAIARAIQEAGEQATARAPLVWLRLEPEALLDGKIESMRYVLDITTWPGGTRRVLGYTDGHVRSVEAL